MIRSLRETNRLSSRLMTGALIVLLSAHTAGCSKDEENAAQGRAAGPAPAAAGKGAASGQDVAAKDDPVGKAKKLVEQGNPDGALAEMRKAATANPNDVSIHRAYQDQLRRAGRLDELKRYYASLAEANAGSAVHQYLYGRSLILEEPAAAERAFKKATELDPNLLWAYLGLGTLRSQAGDHFTAIQIYEKALERFPDSPYLYFNLADARYRIGAYRTALEAANKTISLKQDFVAAYQLVALVHFARNAYEQAQEYAEKTLAYDSSAGIANLVMARVLLTRGEKEKALPYAHKAAQAGLSLPPEVQALLKGG